MRQSVHRTTLVSLDDWVGFNVETNARKWLAAHFNKIRLKDIEYLVIERPMRPSLTGFTFVPTFAGGRTPSATTIAVTFVLS
jgi:hypothetical protein